MINSLNFRQNISNTNTIQARPHSLKHSVALRSQPQRDEVCFSGLNIKKACEALRNNSHYQNNILQDIRPIILTEKDGTKEITAFIAKISNSNPENYYPGLAVFSKEGCLLGDIKSLNETEYELCSTPTSEKDNAKENVGKYLRLHSLNASYSNKYRGVGTAIVQAAIEESKKMGLDGQLKVFAYNNIPFSKKGSPIPFYAKMGFISYEHPKMSKEELIEKYSDPENGDTSFLMFLLTKENLEKLKNRSTTP